MFNEIFVERLWQTVKYEDIYLKDDQTVLALEGDVGDYCGFYNHQRLHAALATVGQQRSISVKERRNPF